MTRTLATLLRFDKTIFLDAIARIRTTLGNAIADDVREKVEKGRPKKVVIAERWLQALQSRATIMHGLSGSAKRDYAEIVQKDRRLIRRKVFFPERVGKRCAEGASDEEKEVLAEMYSRNTLECGDVEGHPNDSGLPIASKTERAMSCPEFQIVC